MGGIFREVERRVAVIFQTGELASENINRDYSEIGNM